MSKEDCLLWPGAKDQDGYGFVKLNGKQFRVHRVALEIKLGRKLRKGECALHFCDTPSCFFDGHLTVGSIKENNRQRRQKQRTLSDRFLPGWEKIYGDNSGSGNG